MKKTILFSFIFFAPLFGLAQSSYTVRGQIGKLNKPAMAFLLIDNQGNQQLDSTFIINGKFEFKGSVASPMLANLRVRHDAVVDDPSKKRSWDLLPLFVGKEDIMVLAKDSIKNAVISGSRLNQERNRFNAMLKLLYDKNTELNKEFLAQPESKQKDAQYLVKLRGRAKLVGEEIYNAKMKYISENPDQYMALVALNSLLGFEFDGLRMEQAYNGLSDNLRGSYAGKLIEEKIKKVNKTREGVQALDFLQPNTVGTIVSLSDFRGKYVLIDFWASWCAPCRNENPNLVKAYSNYNSKGFEILGVSLDKLADQAKWLKAIHDDKLTWTQVSDLKGWANEAAGLYDVTTIPMNFLIDPLGKIVAKNLRGEQLDEKLKTIFQQ